MSTTARRALISVHDKADIENFATALRDLEILIISTGGTARAIRKAGVACSDISEVTGFPEMMDGRVKTLHPCIHGALLALRDNPDHMATLAEHDIAPIDIVCVNLYPFEQTIARPGCTDSEAIEQIDIGGPTMLRSAAKNHESVYVLSSPSQYGETIARLQRDSGLIDTQYARQLALEVYRTTSAYDTAISAYLTSQIKVVANES